MAPPAPPSLDLSRGLAGKLIIALPHLDDTPFEKSVCLICSHDDEHAFGAIVNKPMKGMTVAEVVAGMNIEADGRAGRMPVFFGGPVGMERGAVLHSLDYRREETLVVGTGLGLTATKAALEAICDDRRAPRHAMLIMGHAGWDGGQLENEIKRNDWLSINASQDLVFGDAGEAWRGALGELGIPDPAMFGASESQSVKPN